MKEIQIFYDIKKSLLIFVWDIFKGEVIFLRYLLNYLWVKGYDVWNLLNNWRGRNQYGGNKNSNKLVLAEGVR